MLDLNGVRRAPPGPPVRTGVLPSLHYYWSFLTNPIGFVERRFERYGDIYCAPSSDGGLFVLRHPDHIHEVLVSRASSFGKQHSAFAQLSRVLGNGLLVSEGETWARHRRMMSPGFAAVRMSAYAEVMVAEARRTAGRWRDGDVVALEHEMTELTLRIVGGTLFGQDVGRSDVAVIARAMKAAQRALSDLNVLPKWLPTPRKRELGRSLEGLDAVMYRMIRERRAGPAFVNRTDVLQLLVDAVDPEAKTTLSELEVRDQLVTLFLAGHETTSQALTWAFHCLATAPAAERRLQRELATVLDGRDPSYEDLEKLPYTEQVMLEAMRLYPPVYVIARRAHEDTEVGKFPVPRGSEVVIWVYMTHRHPGLWRDPDAFRPERFETSEAAGRPRLAYLPFGAGPRACIGRAFAMIEARLILATIAQRYRLAHARRTAVVPRPMITLTPKGGISMRVRRR